MVTLGTKNIKLCILLLYFVFITLEDTVVAGQEIENYQDLCNECQKYKDSYRLRGWFCWTACGAQKSIDRIQQNPTIKNETSNTINKSNIMKTKKKNKIKDVQQSNVNATEWSLSYFFSDEYKELLVDSSKLIEVLKKARCIFPKDIDSITRALLLQQCFSRNQAQGNETVCYEELGCFPMEKPWISLLRPFPTPHTPDQVDVKLYLYTRNITQRFTVPLWPKIDLSESDYDPNRDITAFITHGFASNGNNSWIRHLKNAYLKNVDANIFVVDWGKGASLFNYLQVASNTRIVGAELGRFGKYLIENGLDPKKIHLMGHSLGSHISAYMSKNLMKMDMGKVGRITALDPAQPGFEIESKEVRLADDDAEFIDVLHTDAKPFIPFVGFGMLLPVGHVDFYLNGGTNQPGCLTNVNIGKIKTIADLADIPVELVSQWVSCSHGRSYQVFTAALNPESNCLWARKIPFFANLIKVTTQGALRLFDPIIESLDACTPESCTSVGLFTPDFKARGIFSLSTTTKSPFCVTDEERDRKVKNILSLGLFSVGNKIKESLQNWFKFL